MITVCVPGLLLVAGLKFLQNGCAGARREHANFRAACRLREQTPNGDHAARQYPPPHVHPNTSRQIIISAATDLRKGPRGPQGSTTPMSASGPGRVETFLVPQ